MDPTPQWPSPSRRSPPLAQTFEPALDLIVSRWFEWFAEARTSAFRPDPSWQRLGWRASPRTEPAPESARLHRLSGRTAETAPMRTAPVALAYLDDEEGLVQAARLISELTHFDPEAGDACVLWSAAIRHAVLTAELDARVGFAASTLIDVSYGRSASMWRVLAARGLPNNGWVVTALQAAWSAIATTPVPDDDHSAEVFRADHFRIALDAAVRAGDDTDTVAAIAAACWALRMGRRRRYRWSGGCYSMDGPAFGVATW